MPTKTDDLIRQLAEDARPVKRLPPPGRRFALWLALSVAYALMCLLWIGWRADLSQVAATPGFLWQTALLVALTLSSGWLAFAFSVPGREGSPWRKRSVVLVALAWLASLVTLVAVTPGHSPGEGLACSLQITLVGAIPAILLVLMIRRAAPLQWLWSGILVGLAMIGLGATALQFACCSGDPMHLLVWHLLPGVLFVVIAVALASRLFKI
ncbi:MAG TPA: DUF1109 domain-containing protein [Kiritimatiellia bacterium]|nr:DUF1109 domain-containing protein [Kiritimatiellia bacterium]